MHRTFQERGYCIRAGYQRLAQVLGEFCGLGNAALEERRDAWRTSQPRIAYQDSVPVADAGPGGKRYTTIVDRVR